ncbi:YggS family pyridoxal phosphate-dependent enzyme, partial [Candidatus Peregrinibacteria bacterium]|nr:YggS family pyridoxal phosphate-dependent enzyme [Candidatus Peregrinibacteria bacterium]
AENRWPDCKEKFECFMNHEKHFIGHLQKNKVNKVVPLVDMIQSVDSIELLEKINSTSKLNNKTVNFLFQINISLDPKKSGIHPENIEKIIEKYKEASFANTKLCGLMTMGEAAEPEVRRNYYKKFKSLFDSINNKYFAASPLSLLSMGTSSDFGIALEEGATMVRLGRAMYNLDKKI